MLEKINVTEKEMIQRRRWYRDS